MHVKIKQKNENSELNPATLNPEPVLHALLLWVATIGIMLLVCTQYE